MHESTTAGTQIRLRGLLTATFMVLATSAGGVIAQDGCEQPDMPVMPDGASATLEDMLAGQKSIKAFQSSNMEFMKCLESTFKAAKISAEATGSKSAKATHSEALEAYNAAVSAEEEVAGQFNVELREYKAANK